MQNKVINHILHNKIAYAIAGIVLAVIGFTLAQTPNFSDQALSGNVGDVVSSDASKPSVAFTDATDFTVAQNGKVTLSAVTLPKTKVSFWLVNSKPGVRPVNVGTVTADAAGVAVYDGTLSSKTKLATYRIGVQASSANGTTLAVSDFAVKVTAPVANTTAASLANTVTLVTSSGSKVTVKQGDAVTVTLPATVTTGVTVTMESVTSSFAPVTVAKNVTDSSVTWKITNNVTGALRVNVTNTAGVSVPGVTVTVADGTTGVTTGMAATTQTTATAPVTTTMESNVKADLTFTSPTAPVTAVATKTPVVVSLKAATATELFTLYAVNVATGKQTVVSKGVSSGQTVTWLPMEAGNYQLVAAGSTAQVTSPFTVTVVSATATGTSGTSAPATGTTGSGTADPLPGTPTTPDPTDPNDPTSDPIPPTAPDPIPPTTTPKEPLSGATSVTTSTSTSTGATTVVNKDGFAATATSTTEKEADCVGKNGGDCELEIKDCGGDPIC